ncbi:MAG: zinc finger domain-containing protein, partial [Candidatus Binatia bacterium]
ARSYRQWQQQSYLAGAGPGYTQEFYMGELGDIFGDLGGIFGRGRRAARSGPARGQDIEAAMDIDFLDAVRGFQTALTLQRPVPCETCKGSGTKPGSTPKSCPECGGAGTKPLVEGPLQFRQTCPRCGGTGQVPGDPCPTCGGAGRVLKSETIRVNIPPGAQSGQLLRVKGKGVPAHGRESAGDLYLRLMVRVPKDKVGPEVVEKIDRAYTENVRKDLRL